MRLKQRKRPVQRASRDSWREEFVDNRSSLRSGGYESGGAVLDCRPHSGATQLDGEEDLASCVVVKLSANKEGEGGELERVEVLVGGEKMRGLTRAEAVGKLGK